MAVPKSFEGTSFRVFQCGDIIQRLRDDVNVADVLPKVQESELLSQEECSRIFAATSIEGTSQNSVRISKLVDAIVARPSPHNVDKFLKCLRDSEYEHAAQRLEEYLDMLYHCQEDGARTNHLKAGLVPGEPSLFVSRKEFEFKIKDQIIYVAQRAQTRANHGTHWVISTQ